ncbi:MAG: hypothetical protein WBZ29_02260 [Methanocella sp.]
MKKIAGEIRDFKGWASFAIDAIAKGKTDINALKVIVALAIIVLPGGMLLNSASPVYQSMADVLLPATNMLQGPVTSMAPSDMPDNADIRQPVLTFISTPTPGTDVTARDVATTGPATAGMPEATPMPSLNLTTWPLITPEPSRAPVSSDTPTPVPTDTPTPTLEPTATPTPTPEPTATPTPTPEPPVDTPMPTPDP